MENCFYVCFVVLSREYIEEFEVMIMVIRMLFVYVGFFVFFLCIILIKFYLYKYNVIWN